MRELIVGSAPWELPATLTSLPAPKPMRSPSQPSSWCTAPDPTTAMRRPNKPFRDLAEGLATAGIAVLRYEKRTLHYATELTSAEDTAQERPCSTPSPPP